MSSVRMCDKCGDVFSENSEGWATFNGSTRKRNENGQWTTVQESMDTCAECSFQPIAPKVKAIANYPVMENENGN